MGTKSELGEDEGGRKEVRRPVGNELRFLLYSFPCQMESTRDYSGDETMDEEAIGSDMILESEGINIFTVLCLGKMIQSMVG